MSNLPDNLATLKDDMVAFIEGHGMRRFPGYVDHEEVQAVMRWATANKVAVVPRGMGTGLSGGATALTGGIVLSTEKMRDITVDPVTRVATAPPSSGRAATRSTSMKRVVSASRTRSPTVGPNMSA